MLLVHRKYDFGNDRIFNGFLLVRVYSLNSQWKHFLAQIIDGTDEDGDS